MKSLRKLAMSADFIQISLFFILIPFISSAQTRHFFSLDSIPEGQSKTMPVWLYHAGDNPEWAKPEYKDEGWDTLSTKLILRNKVEDFFPGIGWFRLHIEIDSSLMNKTFALTMNQRGASQVYHNGDLVKESGTIGTDTVKEVRENPKDIPIIIHFDSSRQQVLAVRYSHKEAFENLKKYNEEKSGFVIRIGMIKTALNALGDQIRSSTIILSLFIIFVVLGVLHFLLFLFFREKKANLFYSIFVIGFSMLLFWTYAVNSYFYNPDFSMIMVYFISLLFPWLFIPLIKMLYTLFLEKSPRIYRILLGLSALITILYYFRSPHLTILYSGYTVLVFIEVLRIIGLAIFRKKPGIWIIGSGVILFVIFFLVIALIILFQGSLTIDGDSILGVIFFISITLAILSIPLSMSVYLARDFALTNKNLLIQIENVKMLSAKSFEQEKEKQRILEGQKERLEVMVTERTRELAQEKEKTEQLLLNTLPLKVVNDLKMNGKTEPESFDEVTVYFSDIVGFTNISTSLEPAVLIGQLNEIFTAFDNIMERNQCERIKTIGDAYLAVCGMPERRENHAQHMARAALEIKDFLEQRNTQNPIQWKIRIGLHSGKVVGGVVGIKKYIYDVFGDTINTTSRMESNSEPMRINVSETTYYLLQNKFTFTPREPMEIKGKGLMRMYFLEG
jgi:class 3 adenylate cyclase